MSPRADLSPLYDVVIVGGGPAGMSAAVFAGRRRLRTLVLEKGVVGGQPAVAERIENFPGFPGLDGWDLAARLERHARSLGVEVVESAEVGRVRGREAPFLVEGSAGTRRARAVIAAAGGTPRRLGVPGEEALARRGVHYCAHCAGFAYQGKRIAVVGGGESALLGALYLAGIGGEVVLIHRRRSFRGERILQDRLRERPGVTLLQGFVVEAVLGSGRVEAVRLREAAGRARRTLDVDAVFVYIGFVPNSGFLDVAKDPGGFVRVDRDMAASTPGIFACGGLVRENPQIVTSMGEGALAALSAARFLARS